MTAEQILAQWKKGQFQPLYWLEGEESYFIDKLVNYAEKQILDPSAAAFDLMVFYGRDTAWTELVNACMQFPMNSDRKVVILKEAQHMRELDRLEGYVSKPLGSTVLVVAHKEKKLDGRSKLARLLKDKAVYLNTKKLPEHQLAAWVEDQVRARGGRISAGAAQLMADHIGNDLSRIEHELDKLLLNLKKGSTVTEKEVEQYVGISREYNPFALSGALARRDFHQAAAILHYYASNPRTAPIQLVLPAIYGLFSKAWLIFGIPARDEKTIASGIGVPPFRVGEYLAAAKNYGKEGVEQAILLLHQYNLRSVGVGDAGSTHASLMKELVGKLMLLASKSA